MLSELKGSHLRYLFSPCSVGLLMPREQPAVCACAPEPPVFGSARRQGVPMRMQLYGSCKRKHSHSCLNCGEPVRKFWLNKQQITYVSSDDNSLDCIDEQDFTFQLAIEPNMNKTNSFTRRLVLGWQTKKIKICNPQIKKKVISIDFEVLDYLQSIPITRKYCKHGLLGKIHKVRLFLWINAKIPSIFLDALSVKNRANENWHSSG